MLDALRFALGANNRKTGLPMSRGDKRRAITVALGTPGLQLSHRALAKLIGCSDKTVTAVESEYIYVVQQFAAATKKELASEGKLAAIARRGLVHHG